MCSYSSSLFTHLFSSSLLSLFFPFFFLLVTLLHMLWTYAKMLILKSCLHSSWAVIKSFVCFVGKLHSAESMSSCTGNQTILTNSVAFMGSEWRDGLAHAECRDQNTFCLSTEAVIQTWLLILNQKKLEMFACCKLLCMLDRYSSIADYSFWSISSPACTSSRWFSDRVLFWLCTCFKFSLM